MDRIVRPVEVAELLGVSISTVYEMLANPSASHPLPRPRKVGPRAVGWPLSELEEFIRALPRAEGLPRQKRRKAVTVAQKSVAK